MRIKLEWPERLWGTWVASSYQYEPTTWEKFCASNVSSRRTTIELLRTHPDSAYCQDVHNLRPFSLELSEAEYINKLRPAFQAKLVSDESYAADLRSRKWRSFFEEKRGVLCFRNASNHELDFKVRLPRTASWGIFELKDWAGECEISHWFIDTVRYGDIDNIMGARPGKYVTTWGWSSTQIAFNSNIAEDLICIESFYGGVLRIHFLR